MASEEFKRLQEALRKAPTEEARKAASEAMRKYLEARKEGSKPTLVNLGYGKAYPVATPLENIPEELEKNPAFFEHLSKIIEAEEN